MPIVTHSDGRQGWQRRDTKARMLRWFGWLIGVAAFV